MNMNVVYKTLKSDRLIEIDDEKRKLIQNELICMMSDLNSFLVENNINYSLGGGSMLGAVRHQGFIPWDDDIDINMDRKEFDKFYSIFKGSSLSDKYELIIPGDENYYYHFPRLIKKGTQYRTIQDLETDKVGLPIDIFIVENLPDNIFLKYIQGILSTFLLYIGASIRTYRIKTQLKELGLEKKFHRKILVRTIFSPIINIIHYTKWFRLMDSIFSIYKNCKRGTFVVIPSGRNHFWGEIYAREKLMNLQLRRFDKEFFFTYSNESYYLSKLYGNYMEVPAEDKREKHSILNLVL
ncbi:lipopolysaccharide cholinephosphotransferase [Pasteurella langaaensis DSM 22999]|uniref:Lipopolysaccharide cholinephosphotransferase n=1 Tax=Alitibacter langaaensis DSM 22999 TaxID=1122935 RepID=A0A2U0THD3_9PAST|nr:LicD family protein [Pasteurella langaaensis]PVX42954.1 lipopolysaccharide cholinephosphotransferase [Pasteurella langaaensis DSM 22999]